MRKRPLHLPLSVSAFVALASCAPVGEFDDWEIAAPPAAVSAKPPPPPRTGPLKPIVLHAKKATVHGKGARYEVGGGKDNIGFWTNAKDWVSWDFDLADGGTFLVEITYACARGSGDSTYALALGEKTLTGKVEETGSWTAFVDERLGVLGVNEPGRYTLSVKPLTKPRLAVMNLQAITLRPGRWEKGLVASWQFDEGWGEAAVDALTSTEDTVHFARWVRGARETGLRFNGFSSSVTRAAGRAPRMRKALTIEAWVKLYARPQGWCPIANQHQYPLGYFFGLDGAGDLGLHLAIGGKWQVCTSSVRLPMKQWTHVAATFDRQSGIAVYVNGVETGRLAVKGEMAPAEEVDLVLGKHNHFPWSFNGVLDEVRVFDRALGAEEVLRHYASEKAELAPGARLVLRGVHPDRQTARVYERVTLEVDLQASYDNPFDASDVGVDAIVTTPSLKLLRAPGFLYQPFERRLAEAEEELPETGEGDFPDADEEYFGEQVDPQPVIKEHLEPMGPPRWQVRLSFQEPGAHLVRVAAWDQTGKLTSEPLRIDVLPAERPPAEGPPAPGPPAEGPPPERPPAEGPPVEEPPAKGPPAEGPPAEEPPAEEPPVEGPQVAVPGLPPGSPWRSPTYRPGMIRRHGTDHRYFVTDRGDTFFPIGANVCWGGEHGTFSYDEWLPRYAEQGCNFFRVWLSPFWTTFAMNAAETGFDEINLGNAWRLDHVLETAEGLGLRVMLCIDSFNILRSTMWMHGRFEESPYIRAQGGPIKEPSEYFTHPLSVAAYRNRLRYLVARYGYSDHVFAWEFWNEVDIIDEYDSKIVAAWHAETARYLRELDPWRHLITTSFAGPKADAAVTMLSEMDLTQTHCYGPKDMVKELEARAGAREIPKDRPHFFGEFGISSSGEETAKLDPAGIHLHNALYASVGHGRAGTPMTWWWDSYVHERDLYGVFGAFARWVEGFDFVREKARRARLQVECEDVVSKEPATLVPLPGTWESAQFNQPLTARVDREGVMTCSVALSDILHGLGFHRELHNPVMFELDVPEATTFGVEVKGVSGFGDGSLEISLDGMLVLEKSFPVPAGNEKDVLTQYNGTYSIDLPEGRHQVEVANTANDWVSLAAYKIPWLKTAKVVDKSLRACGVAGEDRALVWIQNRDYVWSRAAAEGYKARSVRNAKVSLLGLAAGGWTVEHWDTREGRVTKTEEATVGDDGKLTVELPEVTWDAALRLRRKSP